MDKTQKQITKDPKGHEKGKKSRKTYMRKVKEETLRDNQLSTCSSTDNFTSFSSSSTDNSTTSTYSSIGNFTTTSSDARIYGVDAAARLTIGVCVFFKHNKRSSQTANKE